MARVMVGHRFCHMVRWYLVLWFGMLVVSFWGMLIRVCSVMSRHHWSLRWGLSVVAGIRPLKTFRVVT